MSLMKRVAYITCGILMPFVVGLFISLVPIVLPLMGIKALAYKLITATILLFFLCAALLMQRSLRRYAKISLSLSKKVFIYGAAITWWVISVLFVGINIHSLVLLGRTKTALVQQIRFCWIASRLSGKKNPTYSTLMEIFPEKDSKKPRHRASFSTLRDPRTNSIITSEAASNSSCFDIYAKPAHLSSMLVPSLRATLPDRTDESSSVFQNMTESIMLKGKDLKTRPWNRIKPEDKNILRTCSSPLGIGCNESLNSQGQAW